MVFFVPSFWCYSPRSCLSQLIFKETTNHQIHLYQLILTSPLISPFSNPYRLSAQQFRAVIILFYTQRAHLKHRTPTLWLSILATSPSTSSSPHVRVLPSLEQGLDPALGSSVYLLLPSRRLARSSASRLTLSRQTSLNLCLYDTRVGFRVHFIPHPLPLPLHLHYRPTENRLLPSPQTSLLPATKRKTHMALRGDVFKADSTSVQKSSEKGSGKC